MRIFTSFLTFLILSLGPLMAVKAADFTDSDLRSLLKEQPKGILYIWSPRMPLSEMFLPDARDVAKASGIAFVELVDPHAPSPRGRKLDSLRLLKKGVLNHYPSIVFFKGGKLLPAVLHGHETRESLSKIIKERLLETK